MGSGYFGEPNMGNDQRSGGGGTTTSSRKSNKKGNTAAEKVNKQPQRGLGVAQLEKIRLHSQLGSATPPICCNNNPNINYHHHHHLPNPNLNPNPIPPPNYNLTGTNHHHHQYHHQVEEDMRLVQTTSGYSSSYSFPGHHHQSINVMGLSDLERTNLRYGDAVQSAAVCSSSRWSSGSSSNSGGGAIINNGGGLMDSQQFTQPSMTRQLLDLQLLDHNHQNDTIIEKRRIRKDGRDDDDDDESSGHQDLDLELRLSLKY